MVDFPLVFDSASRRSGRADCVEDHGRLWGERGDHAAPFGNVAFLETLQLGRIGLWQSPRDGLDAGEAIRCEECGEDLGTHCPSGAEYGSCCHRFSVLDRAPILS